MHFFTRKLLSSRVRGNTEDGAIIGSADGDLSIAPRPWILRRAGAFMNLALY